MNCEYSKDKRIKRRLFNKANKDLKKYIEKKN